MKGVLRMAKRRKRKARRVPSGHDRHHILFYRKEWSKGYAMKLRGCFVYEVPIAIHQELHARVEAVPVLSEADAERLWILFQGLDRELSLFEALAWLIQYSPDEGFGSAIMAQLQFLQNEMGRF